MSASLEALIDFIRENHTIEEIVGGSGCVSWVSQVEDAETARSLEPGTLAVTSGLVVKTDNGLDELIKALSESRAAGIIITSGLTPTEKLIPLFRMPTGTKTPRLIRDCGHFLMRQESKELNVVRAMKSILSGSGRNDPALRYLEQHGFPSMSRYYLLASEDQVGAEGGAHSCSFRYGGCLLTVLCTDDRMKCLEAAEDCDGAVGIASFRSPDELPTAYRQALSAMKTAKLSGKSPVFYRDRRGKILRGRPAPTDKGIRRVGALRLHEDSESLHEMQRQCPGRRRPARNTPQHGEQQDPIYKGKFRSQLRLRRDSGDSDRAGD